MEQQQTGTLTQPNDENLDPDRYVRYSLGIFKRRNYPKRNPLMTSTYQADYCRFYYTKGNKKIFAPLSLNQNCPKGFGKTLITKKNSLTPKFGCQNNIVNRLFNRTLDGLLLKPKKNYLQSLPFIQSRKEEMLSKSLPRPMPLAYNPMTQSIVYDNTLYQNKPENTYRTVETCPDERKSKVKPITISKSVDVQPVIKKDEQSVESKDRKNFTYFIPKKEEFKRPSILNNYKPFLIDGFHRYGEY